MSLDLYAGPLGKYYQRDFETPQQRLGREQGWETSIVYAGEEPEWLTPDNVRQVIEAFKSQIFEAMGEVAPEISNWNENTDQYITEQIFHECHAALQLITAYTYRSELSRPKRLPENLDADPAFSEASDKDYYIGPLAILESHLFLPDTSKRIFASEDPMGWQVVITTTSALRHALEYLADKIWQGRVMPDEWFIRGAVPTGKVMVEKKTLLPWNKNKWVTKDEEHNIEDEVLWNAEYAYGVFFKMLNFAEDNNVPIRQDG